MSGPSRRSTRSRSSAATVRAERTGANSRRSSLAGPQQLFRFCQLDFSFSLGPADGRYLARGDGDELDVVTFRTSSAPRPPRRGRRPKPVQPGETEPEPVPLSRVTVIGAGGFEDEASASIWLERCRKDEQARERAIEAALRVVNRALYGHRIAGADPYVREVSGAQAQAARLGYGTGDELVEGYWKAAYNVAPGGRSKRSPRRQMIAPQEELAGILSGRRPAHPSEDLVLRARLDLDQRRPEQAALQLRAAVDALEAELEGASGSHDGESLKTSRARSSSVHELAEAAARATLDESQVLTLTSALEELERVIRRRRHRQT